MSGLLGSRATRAPFFATRLWWRSAVIVSHCLRNRRGLPGHHGVLRSQRPRKTFARGMSAAS